MFRKLNKNNLKKFAAFGAIFIVGIAFGYLYVISTQKTSQSIQEEKNTPKAFLSESYDKIKENFWDNISDAQLVDLFRLAAEKNSGLPLPVKIDSKEKLISEILKAQSSLQNEQKNKFLPVVLAAVLSSLNPSGRSGLYTEKLEEQLKNTVNNVNPDKDLYKDLGLEKGASQDKVEEAYDKKQEELKKDSSPEAQNELKQIAYAKEVLSKDDTKARYDSGGIEPTIFSQIIRPGILYIQFKKFSPTSYDEFQKAFESYKDDSSLYGLIFDLRGNIGGAIDATPFFLGNFIGQNAYAFDFYHKGEYLPFKTPTAKLPSVSKYREVVILIDNHTQSSAEIMTASLKKYHVGVVVGVPTKGWGTVERVFSLDNQIGKGEKYSMFLVHSITLREDNLPIEGRGVDPDINITSTNWEAQLFSYFRNSQLVDAVKSLI